MKPEELQRILRNDINDLDSFTAAIKGFLSTLSLSASPVE